MHDILDLDRFPIDQPDTPEYAALVAQCQMALVEDGMYNLVGFLRLEHAQSAADALKPEIASKSFTHNRQHNIYFNKELACLPADHPALTEFQTINHTLCADQLVKNTVTKIYQWQPLVAFLALTMGKEKLFTMDDPLAKINVMAYQAGETLNWHFDRSEFTTTLLLQAPESGGHFEYRTNLRTADDPNYDGVAKLLRGEDPKLKSVTPKPGTLNVFRGINTPHRVTEIRGDRDRIIAVYSFYDRSGVIFSPEEQIGFYGRTTAAQGA